MPFGKARLLSQGDDVTLVGISHAAVECMRARASLAEEGISAEVIDPVSLSPLDVDTIAGSVARTRSLIVVDTAWTFCGASAEIIAAVGERLRGSVAFRFQRMGFAPVVCPTTRKLERLFYPTVFGDRLRGLLPGQGAGPVLAPNHVEAPEIFEFKGPF